VVRHIIMHKKWISGIEKLVGEKILRDIRISLDNAPNHRRLLHCSKPCIINNQDEMWELISEFTDNPAIKKNNAQCS